MGDIMRDITAIATALIGVALITVLVRQSSNTAGVINAASSGFAKTLTAAMGGGSSF